MFEYMQKLMLCLLIPLSICDLLFSLSLTDQNNINNNINHFECVGCTVLTHILYDKLIAWLVRDGD